MKKVSVRKRGLSLFLSILFLGNPLPLYKSPSHPQSSFLASSTVVGKAAALSSILTHLQGLTIHLESGKTLEEFSTPAPEGLNILTDIIYRPGVIAVIPFHWEGKPHTAILSDKSNPFVFPDKFDGAIQEQDLSRYRVQWVTHEAKNAPATVRVKLLKALLQHSGRPAGKMDSMNGLSVAEFINEEAGARQKSVADAIQARRAFNALDELTRANPDKIKRFQTDKTVKFFFQDLVVPDRTATLITQQLAEASPKVRETIQRHFDYLGLHRDQESEIANSLRASVREIYNTAMEKLRANHPDLPTDIQIDIEPLDSPQEILVNGGAGTVVGIYKGKKTPENLIHSFYILYGPKTTLICPARSGLKEFIYHAHNGVWVDNRTQFSKDNVKKGAGKTISDGDKEEEKPAWWNRFVETKLDSNKDRYTESPVYITNEILLGPDAKGGRRNNGGILQKKVRPGVAHALGHLVEKAGGAYLYSHGRLFAGIKDLVEEVRQLAAAHPEEGPAPEEKEEKIITPISLEEVEKIPSFEGLIEGVRRLDLSEDIERALNVIAEETIAMTGRFGMIPAEKTEGENTSGDIQAVIDVVGHQETMKRLHQRGPDGRAPVRFAISEETSFVTISPTTLKRQDFIDGRPVPKVDFYYERRDPESPSEAILEWEFVPIPSGKGVFAAFDPLDGSSKVDTNGSVGFTGALYESDIEIAPINTQEIWARSQKKQGQFDLGNAVELFKAEMKKREEAALKAYTRKNLRASFFVLYGPITILVLATQKGVFLYTLRDGKYVLWSKEPIRIPEEGPTLAVGGVKKVQLDAIRKHIKQELRGGKTSGYGGSMCGDILKVLLCGGLFAYPPLKSEEKELEKRGTYNLGGKLRGLVEASISAHLIEAAGGTAFTVTEDAGISSPLDRPSEKSIEKLPPVMGSPAQVRRFILALIEDMKNIALDANPKNKSAQGALKILKNTLKWAKDKEEVEWLAAAVVAALAEIYKGSSPVISAEKVLEGLPGALQAQIEAQRHLAIAI